MVSPSAIQEGVKSARVADLSSIDVSGSEVQPSSSDYKPQVDLRRFQQLLEEEEKTHHLEKRNVSLKGQTGGLSSTQVAHTADKEPPVERTIGPGKSGARSSTGMREEVLESVCHRESAWCDDSVHSSGRGGGRGHGGMVPDSGSVQPPSEQGASGISTFPLGSSVRSSEGTYKIELLGGNDRRLQQLHRKLPGAVEDRVDGEVGPAGTVSAIEGHGNTEEEEEEGDEGTLASQNTSKIHADLSRLELVRSIFFPS